MRPTKMKEEERTVLTLTLVFFLGGTICKGLLLLYPACRILDLPAVIFLGLGAGSTASFTGQWIQRTIRERRVREFYAKYEGPWTRQCLFQYGYLSGDANGKVTSTSRLRDRSADNRPICIEYIGGHTLLLRVEYDEGRGATEGLVEFSPDKGIIGAGTYVYVRGPLNEAADNDGFSHSGRYTVHLFPQSEPEIIRVYYDGLMPDPNAKGYEVWRRGTHACAKRSA